MIFAAFSTGKQNKMLMEFSCKLLAMRLVSNLFLFIKFTIFNLVALQGQGRSRTICQHDHLNELDVCVPMFYPVLQVSPLLQSVMSFLAHDLWICDVQSCLLCMPHWRWIFKFVHGLTWHEQKLPHWIFGLISESRQITGNSVLKICTKITGHCFVQILKLVNKLIKSVCLSLSLLQSLDKLI